MQYFREVQVVWSCAIVEQTLFHSFFVRFPGICYITTIHLSSNEIVCFQYAYAGRSLKLETK